MGPFKVRKVLFQGLFCLHHQGGAILFPLIFSVDATHPFHLMHVLGVPHSGLGWPDSPFLICSGMCLGFTSSPMSSLHLNVIKWFGCACCNSDSSFQSSYLSKLSMSGEFTLCDYRCKALAAGHSSASSTLRCFNGWRKVSVVQYPESATLWSLHIGPLCPSSCFYMFTGKGTFALLPDAPGKRSVF
jgi:hypothetical protein